MSIFVALPKPEPIEPLTSITSTDESAFGGAAGGQVTEVTFLCMPFSATLICDGEGCCSFPAASKA
ncbi:MAG: hypothetical protein Q8919_05070, partial [Bacteroidota bacterium]|nr:hypothetical protein [Bacteroidota bacterium]